MPHKDVLLPQSAAQGGGFVLRVGGKDKIRGRIQHCEPALPQPGRRFGAGLADSRHGFLEVRLVRHGGGPGGLAHRVYVVGAVAELDAVHVGDQPRLRHTEPQPCARQAAGFGEGAHHHQVFVFCHQRQAGRPRPGKVDIRLVHNNGVVRVALHDALDRSDRRQQACRRVGVGKHDGLAKGIVGGRVEREILPQRQHMRGHAQQVAQNGVEAVGDIGKRQRRVLVAERADGQQQVFVAAVAAQDPLGRHAAARGDGCGQLRFGQVGVKAQPFDGPGHRCGDAGGRGIGVLVGVQLDKAGHGQLFAGRVWLQRRQRRGEKSAHRRPPPLHSASLS